METKNKKAIDTSYQSIDTNCDEYKVASAYGYIDNDGNVHLRKTIDGNTEDVIIETVVGMPANATEEQKNDIILQFVKSYYELLSLIDYFDSTLELNKIDTREIDDTVSILERRINRAKAIGSYEELQKRFDNAKTKAEQLKEEIGKLKSELAAKELEYRNEVYDQIKALTSRDDYKFHEWQSIDKKINKLVREWSEYKPEGFYQAALDRKTREEIWRKIYKLRHDFGARRSEFFSRHKHEEARIKNEKNELIERLRKFNKDLDVELSDPNSASKVNFDSLTGEIKNMFDEWKEITNSYEYHSRALDGRLWKHFKREIDKFYTLKRQGNASDYLEKIDNYLRKLDMIEFANYHLEKEKGATDEKLVKRIISCALNANSKFDDVPKNKKFRIDRSIYKLTNRVRKAKEDNWRKNDPDKSDRVNSVLAQLEKRIADLEEEKSQAEKNNDEKKISSINSQIEADKKMIKMFKNA